MFMNAVLTSRAKRFVKGLINIATNFDHRFACVDNKKVV